MVSRFFVWVIAGAALVGLSACEPSKTKKTSSAPPRQATAPTLTASSPADEPKIKEKLVPRTDPVESLISRVEKEFQAGQADYRAGHLERAKVSFDRAFNLLLSYPAG